MFNDLSVGEEIRIRCVEAKQAPKIRKKNHNRSVKKFPKRCDKCIFQGIDRCYLIHCGEDDRSDGKDVYFIAVKD